MKAEQDFYIGVQMVDQHKVITNASYLELFSDICMKHSNLAGFTKTQGLSPASWVVLNWKMKVYERVPFFSTIHLESWVQSFSGFRAVRSCVAKDPEGKILAEGSAVWIALNTATGTIFRLKPEFMEPFGTADCDPVFPGYKFPDARSISFEPEFSAVVSVPRMMLDYNGHVHNSEYLNLADEILPEEIDRRTITDIEIIYKLEVKAEEKQVLLEYAQKDGKYYVAVRSLKEKDLHALLVMG